MTMKLSAEFLRGLADELDALKEIKARVTSIEYRNHSVVLSESSDQRDGNIYFVVGITEGKLGGKLGGALRDGKSEAGRA